MTFWYTRTGGNDWPPDHERTKSIEVRNEFLKINGAFDRLDDPLGNANQVFKIDNNGQRIELLTPAEAGLITAVVGRNGIRNDRTRTATENVETLSLDLSNVSDGSTFNNTDLMLVINDEGNRHITGEDFVTALGIPTLAEGYGIVIDEDELSFSLVDELSAVESTMDSVDTSMFWDVSTKLGKRINPADFREALNPPNQGASFTQLDTDLGVVGGGMAGGLTISMSLNEFTTETAIADDDLFSFYDDSASANKNITWANLSADINSNVTNYVWSTGLANSSNTISIDVNGLANSLTSTTLADDDLFIAKDNNKITKLNLFSGLPTTAVTSLAAGNGLDYDSSTRTFSLDIRDGPDTDTTIAGADLIGFSDESNVSFRNTAITFNNFKTALNINTYSPASGIGITSGEISLNFNSFGVLASPAGSDFLAVSTSAGPRKITLANVRTAVTATAYTGGTGIDIDNSKELTADLGELTALGTDDVDGDALIAVETSAGQRLAKLSTVKAVLDTLTPAAPEAVDDLSAASPARFSLTLSWSRPTATEIDGYDLEYDFLDTFNSQRLVQTSFTGDVTTHTITGLPRTLNNYYRIRAKNRGGVAPWSNLVRAIAEPPVTVTAPDAPTSVSGSPTHNSIATSWRAPSNNGGASITGYIIQWKSGSQSYSSTREASVGANARSYTITGLAASTSYDFRVAAQNRIGSTYSSDTTVSTTAVPVIPDTAPTEPRSVAATASGTSIVTTWSTPASNGGQAISGYTIQWKSGAQSFSSSRRATVNASTSTYTITGLTRGTTYDIQVGATNSIGTTFSSSVSATIAAAGEPDAPTWLLSSNWGHRGSNINIPLRAGSNNGAAITQYEIQAKQGSTDFTSPTHEATANVTISGNRVFTARISSVTQRNSATSLDDYNDNRWYLRVRLINSVGSGDWSEIVAIPMAPVTPTSVTARRSGDDIIVNWTYNMATVGIDGFNIDASDSQNVGGGSGSTNQVARSITLTGSFVFGTTYTISVQARDSGSGTINGVDFDGGSQSDYATISFRFV